MCFSATVSFTAGAALSAVGVLTIRRSVGWREVPLAAVPLLFGVQQITEGVVWLGLDGDLPQLQTWAAYIYSFFSHALWPVLIPIAILLVETERWRRHALAAFVAAGVGVGLYLLFFLFWTPVTATVVGRSIAYESPHFYLAAVIVVYLLATCVSGLFSRHVCIRIFGMLAFVLAVAAAIVSMTTFVSVWCFFAAVLSVLILVHFSGPMQACRPQLQQLHERAAA